MELSSTERFSVVKKSYCAHFSIVTFLFFFFFFLSACTLFVQLKIFLLAFQPLNQRQLQGACFVRVQAALLLIPDAERARSRQSP